MAGFIRDILLKLSLTIIALVEIWVLLMGGRGGGIYGVSRASQRGVKMG